MRNSFENSLVGRLDTDRMHKRAETLIESCRINEEELREIYGDQVSTDLATVARLEDQFAKKEHEGSVELKKVADIFEALILDLGELSNWFGENAFTLKTSKFDDYINGIDMVIEFRGENPDSASYLGVAADVTFTSNASKKFERIRKHITNGELGKVKYFVSEHMNIHGQLSNLPEVVVGASKKTVMQLSELWASKDKDALAKHYAQVMILRQIRAQMDTFSFYAESIGQRDAAQIYSSRIPIIDGILKEKEKIAQISEFDINDDSVHADIMSFLQEWKRDPLSLND